MMSDILTKRNEINNRLKGLEAQLNEIELRIKNVPAGEAGTGAAEVMRHDTPNQTTA